VTAEPTATSTPSSPSPSPSVSPSPSAEVALASEPCPGTDRNPGAPPGRQLAGSSTNWSGYVSAVKETGVTCVEGSWIEPDVVCPSTGHQAVAVWIGIDGFSAKVLGIPSTNVLVQIGTQIDCDNGEPRHGAWKEVLPAEMREERISGVVHAGDHLSARISYAAAEFTIAIFDADTNLDYTITQAAPGAPRKSAEWIVEAPAVNCPSSCSPVAMPKFTTVRFTGAYVTIAGQRAAIDDASWSNVKLKMVRNNIIRDTTSSLIDDGSSFSVSWRHR